MTPEERAAIADARKEEESLRLRGLGLAEKITPDEAAEALTLARKNGVPRVSVETDLQGYRSLDEMERVDSRTRDTPALRRWLAGHDDNYAVARDDVDNLAKIEMSLGERLKSETFLGPLMRGDIKEAYVSSLSSSVAIGRYTSSWAQSVAPMWERQGRGYVLEERDQAYSTYEKAVRVLALQADTDEARKARRNEILNEPVFEGFAPNLRRLRAMMGVNEPLPEMVSPAIMSLFTEVYGANSEEWRQYQFAQPREKVSALKTVLDKTNKVTEAQRQKFRELGERVRMLQPSTGDFIADAMLGGVTSAADQIPAITAGILTRSPSVAAGIMGAKVYGETVGEGIAETDLTFDQAKSRALQQMLVELGMERIAIGYEMRILGDGSSVGSKLARGMVAEQFQEQPTTVLNNYIDWQYLHPDKTLEDFVAEMPEQAAQTFWTTLVASGALQGTMIAMDHALTSADEKARRSLMSEGDKAIEDAIKAAGKSKLAQRSPEKMEEAVRAIAEANGIDKVAVDLDGVVEALNQKGVDPGAVLEALGVDREQAEADGIRFGETQVDLAKVMAAPAVREHLTDIQPHLRSPKDDYTPAQKQKIRDNFGNEIKDRLDMIRAAAEGKAELSDREMQAADLVRQRVEGLGIFAERVANESNADVAVALNSVLAGKMGMDPVEFFEQHFSRIQMSVDGMVKEQEGANRKDLEILYQRIVGNEQTGVQMMEPSDFGVDTAGWTVKRERDVDGDEFARIYDAAGKLKWTVPFTEGKKDGDLIREVVVDTPPEYNARTGVPKPANENTDPELVAAIMEAARSMNPEDPMQVISDAADASEIGVPQALRDNRPADQRASDRWGMSKADKLEQGNDLHRAQYDTIKNIITLFEGRNISTLIHELSHWYLFKLEEFANLENAPEGIRQEWEAIRGWYEQLKADGKLKHIRDRYSVVEENGAFVVYYKGPYDREPQRMSGAMATREAAEATIDWREMHETWAESFEVYMQTNEAPSLALRRAFRVFNSWLTQMWNNLRTTRKAELERANLNPEIVAIFDRMLATEQQIEAASMQAKIEAETVAGQFLKQGILTQKEYERAVKRLPEIIEEVKEELRTQLMADMHREDEAWWRTERERIKADKTRSTDTSPAGRAYNWLGFGAYKGDVPVEESPGEAARADVQALYQSAARNTLDDQIREAEQNNAEVDQEIKTVREMLNEAAACAAGVAPASVGQMVAGTAIALGAGIPMAIIATQMTPQAQAERERRMKEWNLQEHQRLMRENPEYRQRHEQYNARRQAEYDDALAEYRAARQFEQQLEAYSDIDNMPTDDRFDMNSWTEQVTGVSGEFLDDLIGHEADGDWQAEAGTSTAKGGGQFIDSTWLRMMRQHGPELGLNPGMSREDILALRTDRRWGTMMTAYYAMENRAELEKTLDRPVTQKDAYLAHFLGATAAAKALTMDPDANAAEAFPEAAAANQNVFYKYGNLEKPRTVAEMIQRQTKGFSAEPLMVWDYPVEMDAEPNDGRVDR